MLCSLNIAHLSRRIPRGDAQSSGCNYDPLRRALESNIKTQTVRSAAGEVNKAWFLTTLLFAVFGTQNAVMIVPPLLVDIATDLNTTVPVAGQLATATAAAWAASHLTIGPLSDSFGRRPVALAGLLLVTGSVLASAFAPNLATLLVLRVLTGLGGGTIPATSVGVVSDVISPARRAKAVSAIIAINGLAFAVAAPIAAVLADWRGWQFAFLAAGVFVAVCLLANVIWYPIDRTDRVRNLAFFSRYWALLSVRYFRVAVSVGVTQRIAFWGVSAYLAAYLIETFGVSEAFVALPLGIYGAGQVIGSYAAAYVANRKDRALLMAVTSVAGGVFAMLCFSFDLGLWTTVAVATAATTLISVTMPAMLAASTEYSGDSKSTGASLMGFSNQTGGALGAAIGGALLATTGYAGIGYLFLGVTIASALMMPLFGRQFGESAGTDK